MASKRIVKATEYKVRDGDTLESVAGQAGITWQQLAKFNWGTDDPDAVNAFLRCRVGCLNKSEDGKKYILSKDDDPGIIYLPETVPAASFSDSATHTITIRLPAKKSFTPGDCFVKFRPTEKWNGEYGFDWLREADFPVIIDGHSIFGGEKFDADKTNGIIGFHKKEEIVGGKKQLVIDPNGNNFLNPFFPDQPLFDKLKKEYGEWEVRFTRDSTGARVKNYAAYLGIYVDDKDFKPPQQVEIQAFITVNHEPELLYFDYKKEFFEITPEKLPTSTKKEKVTIKCIKAFDEDQVIEVRSVFRDKDSESHEICVGKIIAAANGKKGRRTVKTLRVNVKTPSLSSVGELTGNSDLTLDFVKRILKQPLFLADLSEETLDLRTDPDFKENYVRGVEINTLGVKNHLDLETYCNQQLQAMLKNDGKKDPDLYKDHLKAFYFGQDGFAGLLGESSGDTVVVFANAVESTAVHEWLHSLGLAHTFAGARPDSTGPTVNAKFTYKYTGTENIMDYTHHLEKEKDPETRHFRKARISLYHWQWQVVRNSPLAIQEK